MWAARKSSVICTGARGLRDSPLQPIAADRVRINADDAAELRRGAAARRRRVRRRLHVLNPLRPTPADVVASISLATACE